MIDTTAINKIVKKGRQAITERHKRIRKPLICGFLANRLSSLNGARYASVVFKMHLSIAKTKSSCLTY